MVGAIGTSGLGTGSVAADQPHILDALFQAMWRPQQLPFNPSWTILRPRTSQCLNLLDIFSGISPMVTTAVSVHSVEQANPFVVTEGMSLL